MRLPVRLEALAGALRVKCGELIEAPGLNRWARYAAADTRGPSVWGYRVFSQHGEDGILAGILTHVGIGPGKFVEFGFGPIQNNTLAFALFHRARGVYIDGSRRKCEMAHRMFNLLGRTDLAVITAWLDEQNVNDLISSAVGSGEIDILSIDVDGNDYWLWKAIICISPRVVVIEYNASFGCERAVTVPYDAAFDRHERHASGLYHGMSLPAAQKLAREKGYALVGCDEAGVNAFFVRRDLLGEQLIERSVVTSFREHRARLARGLTPSAQAAVAYSLPVVEV